MPQIGSLQSPHQRWHCLWIVVLILIQSMATTPSTLPQAGQAPDEGATRGQGNNGSEINEVTTRESIRRPINPKQRHVYRVALAQGQYLCVTLRRQELGLIATVRDPNQRIILQLKTRLYRPALLPWVAQQAGVYSLELLSSDSDIHPGYYELFIEGAQRRGAAEEAVIAAQKATADAEQLSEQWVSSRLQEAIGKYTEAIFYWRKAKIPNAEAFALKDIGDIYLTLGQNKRALALYNRALALSKRLALRELQIEALNGIGFIRADLGAVQEGLPYCNEALGLSKGMGFVPGEAQALSNLGLIHSIASDLEKALDLLNRSITLWKTTNDRRGEAEALTNLGYTHSDLGDIHKALGCFSEAVTLCRRVNDRRGEAFALSAIGLEHTWLGEPQKAINAHQKALDIFKDIGNGNGEAIMSNGLGYVYYELGDMQRSLYYFMQALRLHRSSGRRVGEAIAMGYIGSIHNSRGNKQRALQYYRKKLAIDMAVGARRLTAHTMKDMAAAYDSLGRGELALSYYNRALKLSRLASDSRLQAYVLNSIGGMYCRSGEKAKALNLYNEALALLRVAEDRVGEIQTLHNIAQVKRDLGELDASSKELSAALKMAESLRAGIDNPDLRSSYFSTVHRMYELYIDVLMRKHRQNPAAGFAPAAFEASEKARARSLLDMLTESHTEVTEGADPALLNRERELGQLIDGKMLRQARLLGGKHDEGQILAVKKEIEELTAEYNEVRAEIRTTNPRYAALTQPQPLTLAEVQQQLLDPETELLEYSLGEERSYLWAVSTSFIETYELPGRAALEALSRPILKLLADGGELQPEETNAEYWRLAANLSSVILWPALPRLKARRLLIVADGVLQYLPFPALPLPGNQGKVQPPRQEPMVVKYEIVSLPSASAFAALRQQTKGRIPADGTVAVLADPVFDKYDSRVPRVGSADAQRNTAAVRGRAPLSPRQTNSGLRGSYGAGFPRLLATRTEAKTIIDQAGAQKSFEALDFDANLTTATGRDLRGYRIIHFATHGLLNSEHPELSAIVLSLVDRQGSPQNGFLRLYSIYNLDLPVDLVVLSACNMALGKDIKGEGLVGITRGFMYAGATRVVASLWKVDDDATAELMRIFYQKMLQENERPAAALRAAQVAMWEREQWRMPYYWAAFVFQGEWN